MSRDTLLLVTTSYPDRFDGSEAAGAFVADLAEELSTRMPVRVVAPGSEPGRTDHHGSVDVRRFASPGRALSLLSPGRPSDWPAIARTLRSLREQTLAADADGRVMHTLALWILPSGWAAAALEREHGVPYSVWALGSDIWTLGKLPVVRTMLKSVIRGAQGRYSDGFQLGTDAGRIAGLPFEFLPSTRRVNADRRPAPANTPPYRLMFLGRWHPNKGIDLLLDALDLLNDAQWSRIRDVHVAGGGPLESLVRARVAALAARNRPVRVSGFLDRAQAYAAIQDADWVLLPSRIESIPVVLSDAIKLCRPLVATPVGDIPRLFEHNRLGVLANAATAQGIAQAIASALHDDPASYAPGLRDAAVQFDVSRVADALARASMGQPRS